MWTRKRIGLVAAVLTGIVVLALVVFVTGKPAPAKAAGFNAAWYGAAPYVMPLANNPPSLTQVMAQSGVKALTLAFVVADSGCTPAWESDAGLDDVSSDSQVGPVINAIRAAGGDVVVSFGGYGGTKLGQNCGTPQATAAAEQTIINKYSLHAFDFDLEEPEYENAAAINNELGAAQILQANNPGLYESITLPGTTSGTGYFGQQLLNNAKSLGFTPSVYEIMPFDGGFSGASSQITALQGFNTMLTNTFGWSSATAYAHEGVSSMNGRTDSGEYFYQSDFQSLLSFAQTNHMARFTFWAVNRDRQCTPPDNNGALSGTCSSVPQSDWDFSKIVAQFGGAIPPTPGPTATSPTGATATPSGSCAGIAAWNASTIYTNGNQVTYNGSLWQAKWWTQGDIPGGQAGVWTLLGSCSGGGNPTATPTGPTATPTTAPTATPITNPTATATQPTGGNLVTNAGFETGNLSGWSCDPGTAVVSGPTHSGAYALQLNPTSALTGQCTQTITVQPNHSYTLSAYVDGPYAYIGVNGYSSTWTSSTSYTQLSVPFTTSATTTSVTIYVHGWYGQGSVAVDDVALK